VPREPHCDVEVCPREKTVRSVSLGLSHCRPAAGGAPNPVAIARALTSSRPSTE
jgi:hypothetical protein